MSDKVIFSPGMFSRDIGCGDLGRLISRRNWEWADSLLLREEMK